MSCYEYNSDGLQTAEKMKDLSTGNLYFLSKTGYGDGTTVRKDRVVSTKTYPNLTTTDSGGLETTYAYTYYPLDGGGDDLNKVKTRKTTYPEVSDVHNGGGSGSAAVTWEYFDTDGHLRWAKDAAGHVTYYAYNTNTDGLAYTVQDIKTSTMGTDLPLIGDPPGTPDEWTSWTPSNAPYVSSVYDFTTTAGLNIVTQYGYDDQGRLTKIIDPSGTTTWATYNSINQTRVYPAWVAGDAKPLLPVVVFKSDDGGKPTELITVRPNGISFATTTGGAPTGAETLPQTSYASWTINSYNDSGQLTSTDAFHLIPSSGTGVPGTNYLHTSYEYDAQGRLYKAASPDGIAYAVYDTLGRVKEVWRGDDDTGGGPGDPDGSGSPNNMQKLSEVFYDESAPGGGSEGVGDGNVTQSRTYWGGTGEYYTTVNNYDWRDRLIKTLSPAGVASVYTLDNLARTGTVETYAYAVCRARRNDGNF